jgi:catechol 2,3-dioxygenase-like lactoylglutathione lyase family enzyme
LKLAYCGIRVTDLKRSLDFYVRVMGLKQIGRGTMKHEGVYVMLQDEKAKQKLELNWYPRGSKFYTEYVLGEGIDHLGFVVDDVRRACRTYFQRSNTCRLTVAGG